MKITWFGHSAFRIETGESVILVDPFLRENPAFEGDFDKAVVGCTHVVVTHGHDDHLGDAVEICKEHDAVIVSCFEVAIYAGSKGVERQEPVNTGGSVEFDDFGVAFVNALHSSCTIGDDGKPVYLGPACGVVISAEGKSIYHMGDTGIFSDMALINSLFKPDVGLIPIGDRFTMGAKAAAHACKEYFDFKTVIPMHYGTFPIIEQTPDKFLELMEGENVVVPEIGRAFDL